MDNPSFERAAARRKAASLTFARGASLPDPKHLFNSSLEGNTRRAIDIHEGDKLDEAQMATWVKQAAVLPGWVPGRPS